MNRVLLLEDDPVLSLEIGHFLEDKGLACDRVFDGDLFFKMYDKKPYDIFLLDINVPKINGLDVCKSVRLSNIDTPILMLTAFGEIEDKIEAFNYGADDYLVKPFHLEELYVRMQALFRRKNQSHISEDLLKVGDLSINLAMSEVSKNGTIIPLTPKEFKLLVILARAEGRVLSKQQIAEKLWDYQVDTNQNTIEVYINFLRNKIDKPFGTKSLKTKIGFGYYLNDDEA